MDHYSIVDGPNDAPPAGLSNAEGKGAPEIAGSQCLPLRGDDRNRSLAEMAERDLGAALQLLAGRAQYITAASGAAIAMRDGRDMICRASAGTSAPELNSKLQLNSGLTGESIRSRQVLRCDDAEKDPRVNRESCRALGIKSVMVVPLVRENDVVGVFELFADRVDAFGERDIVALERLSEMALVAVGHAEAARRATDEISRRNAELSPTHEEPSIPQKGEEKSDTTLVEATAKKGKTSPVVSEVANIGKCESCGFPVSPGRKLCLDCEAAGYASGVTDQPGEPAFLEQLAGRKESWWDAHMYTVGTILMVALTVVLLVLKFR